MASLSDSAGILFKIKSDSSDVTRDFAKVKGELSSLGTSAETAGGGMASLAGPAALAATAIAAVGAAAVTAVVGLFNLTKAASDYGSAINDASQKSGASVQSIQALGFAAEQSGSSMDAISTSVTKFTNLLGQASLGNEKAQATLAQFGITATDVDGALTQAIAKIQGMTDATQQNAAAQALFKDRGGDVINTIREMGGSLPDTIKKLEDMGIMMSKEDTKAADAFGDSLDLLGTQAKLMGYRFANEFMPQVTLAIQYVSRFLVENAGVLKGWGQVIGQVIGGVTTIFRALPQAMAGVFNAINILFGTNLQATKNWADTVIQIVAPVINLLRGLQTAGDAYGGRIVSGIQAAAEIPKSTIAIPKFGNISTPGGGSGRAAKAPKDTSEADAEREAREAEARRLRAVAAAELEMRNTLEIYRAGYKLRTSALEAELARQEISETMFVRDVNRIRGEAISDEITLNKKLLQNQLLNADERAAIEQRLKVLEIERKTQTQDTATAVIEALEKENTAREKASEAERKRLQEEREAIDAATEAMARQNLEWENFFALTGEEDSPFTRIIDGWNAVTDAIAGSSQGIVDVVDIMSNAFSGMANAIGNVISQYVLYGKTAPGVMRQILAQALATIAAEAAVRAVYALAMGFFFLATGQYVDATNAFISAAIFGSIAVGAALIGRAVAPKQTAQGAANRQSASATGSGRASGQGDGNSGGVYSSQKDITVENGRNRPGIFGNIVIQLKTDAGHIIDTVKTNISNNGALRLTVQDAMG